MEEADVRNTVVYNIWAIERDCVDGVFVGRVMRCGDFTYRQLDGYHCGVVME